MNRSHFSFLREVTQLFEKCPVFTEASPSDFRENKNCQEILSKDAFLSFETRTTGLETIWKLIPALPKQTYENNFLLSENIASFNCKQMQIFFIEQETPVKDSTDTIKRLGPSSSTCIFGCSSRNPVFSFRQTLCLHAALLRTTNWWSLCTLGTRVVAWRANTTLTSETPRDFWTQHFWLMILTNDQEFRR